MNTEAPHRSGGMDVAETLRDFWISRPRRVRRGRKIAGVAAGVAARYGIDPVVPRIALVVATFFGGFGVLLYLLGWLLLPDERDKVSALEALLGKGRSSTPPHMTVGLCIALFPAASWTFGGWWLNGTGVVLGALILIGVFMLHHNRGDQNRPIAPVAEDAAPASFSAQPTSLSPDESTESNYQPPPGVWDPLGADPLGWQFSDEPVHAGSAEPDSWSEPAAPARRMRPVSPGITLGATLLTAAVGTTLAILGNGWFTVSTVIGLSLAVLGLGMVLSSFAGTGRQLLGLAVPLSAIGLLVTVLPIADLPGGGFGELDVRPVSTAEVLDEYERTGGRVELDLSGLPADSDPVKTKVAVGLGEALVVVPENADVTVTCETSVGEVQCLGRTVHGLGTDGVSLTDDGIGDGPKITLDVSSVVGRVEVTRG
jgi:phage shock protein PspC (stress-responsive transcriptional regulator)